MTEETPRIDSALLEAAYEAAADKLYEIGAHHGWWGAHAKKSWRDYDEIGREEFLDIVALVVKAYEAKKAA